MYISTKKLLVINENFMQFYTTKYYYCFPVLTYAKKNYISGFE